MLDPHVQIDETDPLVRYAVGGTPQTAFTIPFAFFDTSHIGITVDEEEVSTGDFTVTGTSGSSRGYPGGTLTLVSPVSNVAVVIYRTTPLARTSDFPVAGVLD